MSYEVIEKNEYGVLVKTDPQLYDCEVCKYGEESPCRVIGLLGCDLGQHYILDQEAAKLETELTPETFTINDMYVESKLLFDCQDKLNNLQIENDQLKERIEELESEKSTELIEKNEGSFYEITTTKCCGIGPITTENYCPNCGRKIMR